MVSENNAHGEVGSARISGRGLFAVAVWGASFVATRIALESFSPLGLVGLRMLIAAGFLTLAARVSGRSMLPRRSDVPVCLLLGGTLALHLLLQTFGLRHTSAINTGWIIGIIPVTIAVGAQLLGQQRLSAIGWLGVATGTGGVLIVTAAEPIGFENAHFGDLLQILSCLTWTFYTLCGARPIARNGALRVTTLAMITTAAIVLPLGLGTGLSVGPITGRAVVALAFLGLVCSGMAYYLWFAASHDGGPTRVAALLYIEPFVTLIAAAAILAEPITANAIAGGVTVLLGVWLVGKGASKPGVD